jgi:hypothetical protein
MDLNGEIATLATMDKTLRESQIKDRLCGIEDCNEPTTYIYTETEGRKVIFQTVYCSKHAGIASVEHDVPLS